MKILLLMILIIILLVLAESRREMGQFVVTDYLVASEKLKGMDGEKTFLLLSDLHNKTYGKNNQRLIRAIHQSGADGILIAGDLMTAKPGKDTKAAEALIKELSAVYPIYYGNGNHEYRLKIYPEDYGELYGQYAQFLHAHNVKLLDNKYVNLPIGQASLCIYGLELDRQYYKRFKHQGLPQAYLEHTLGKPKEENYNILIAHNPVYFEAYAKWGADLTVSGHLHGGVVRLPFIGGLISPRPELFPKYSGGRYEHIGRQLILSRGLGTHTINFRLFNPPELIRITLKGK